MMFSSLKASGSLSLPPTWPAFIFVRLSNVVLCLPGKFPRQKHILHLHSLSQEQVPLPRACQITATSTQGESGDKGRCLRKGEGDSSWLPAETWKAGTHFPTAPRQVRRKTKKVITGGIWSRLQENTDGPIMFFPILSEMLRFTCWVFINNLNKNSVEMVLYYISLPTLLLVSLHSIF